METPNHSDEEGPNTETTGVYTLTKKKGNMEVFFTGYFGEPELIFFAELSTGKMCHTTQKPHTLKCKNPKCSVNDTKRQQKHIETIYNQFYRLRPFVNHYLNTKFTSMEEMFASFFHIQEISLKRHGIKAFLAYIQMEEKLTGPTLNALKQIGRSHLSAFQYFHNMRRIGMAKNTLKYWATLQVKSMLPKRNSFLETQNMWDSIFFFYFKNMSPIRMQLDNIQSWRALFAISRISHLADSETINILDNQLTILGHMPFDEFAAFM